VSNIILDNKKIMTIFVVSILRIKENDFTSLRDYLMKALILMGICLVLIVPTSYGKKDKPVNFERFMKGKVERIDKEPYQNPFSGFEKQHSESDLNFDLQPKQHTKPKKKNPAPQSSVKKQRLDSVVADGSFKYLFSYNSIGHCIEVVERFWDDEDSDWSFSEKYQYAFDEHGNLILEIYNVQDEDFDDFEPIYKEEFAFDENGNETMNSRYYWSSPKNEWIGDSKLIYEFDEVGNYVSYVSYEWSDDDNEWEFSFMREFSYNENYDLLRSELFEWDKEQASWLFNSKSENSYNEKGHLIQNLSFIWNSGNNEWGSTSKSEYIYDEKGNLIEEILSIWRITTQLWQKISLRVYSYDENNNLTVSISYSWNETNQSWAEVSKSEISYDALSNEKLRIRYEWLNNTEEWMPSRMDSTGYDEYNNKILFLYAEWNVDDNSWNETTRLSYEYDEFQNLISYKEEVLNLGESENYRVGFINVLDMETKLDELWIPISISETGWYVNKPIQTNFIYYDIGSDNWSVFSSSIYYYSDLSSSVEVTNEESINVFPNPVEDKVMIDLTNADMATIEIIDIHGNVVLSQIINAGDHLNVSYLARGMYIYNLTINGKSRSGKLIKE